VIFGGADDGPETTARGAGALLATEIAGIRHWSPADEVAPDVDELLSQAFQAWQAQQQGAQGEPAEAAAGLGLGLGRSG